MNTRSRQGARRLPGAALSERSRWVSVIELACALSAFALVVVVGGAAGVSAKILFDLYWTATPVPA